MGHSVVKVQFADFVDSQPAREILSDTKGGMCVNTALVTLGFNYNTHLSFI